MANAPVEVTPESRGLAGLVLRKIKALPGGRKNSWEHDNKVMYIGIARSSNDTVALNAYLAFPEWDFSSVKTAVDALRETGVHDIASALGTNHLEALRTIKGREAEEQRPFGQHLSVELLKMIAATPDDIGLWTHIIYDRKVIKHKDAADVYDELKSCVAPALAMGVL